MSEPQVFCLTNGIFEENCYILADPETSDAVLARAERASHVLVSAFARVTGSKGTADMRQSLAALVRRLAAEPAPVIVVSYGSPYLLRQFPDDDKTSD